MTLSNLQDLFAIGLKELYSAENQLTDVMPMLESAATDAGLKRALRSHFHETEEHVHRLESICHSLGIEPEGRDCVAMEKLIEDSETVVNGDMTPRVRDAALIGSSQRLEHYEMAAYGTIRAYAEQLGDYDTANLLQITLNEEGHANQVYTRLAERSINFVAKGG